MSPEAYKKLGETGNFIQLSLFFGIKWDRKGALEISPNKTMRTDHVNQRTKNAT